jgi:hypothetical protein
MDALTGLLISQYPDTWPLFRVHSFQTAAPYVFVIPHDSISGTPWHFLCLRFPTEKRFPSKVFFSFTDHGKLAIFLKLVKSLKGLGHKKVVAISQVRMIETDKKKGEYYE